MAQANQPLPSSPSPPEDGVIEDLATHPHPNVSPSQLAAYWGVNMVVIHRWIRKGALRAFKVGASWRVRTRDAEQFEKWAG